MSIMINLVELLSCCSSQCRQERQAFEGVCACAWLNRKDWQIPSRQKIYIANNKSPEDIILSSQID